MADLAVSLHRLLRARRSVRWDWLPLATALLALLAVLELWWVFYASRDGGFFTTLGGFLPMVAQLVLLFLLNAAALPDEVTVEGLDLRAFYQSNGPYFWSLYAVYLVFILAIRVIGMITAGGIEGGIGQAVLSLVPNLVLLALFIALARSRRRTFHGIAVLGLLALFLVQWSGLQLGIG